MLKSKEFKKYSEMLSHMAGKDYFHESGIHHISLRPRNLLDWIELLKEDLGFFTLIDIAAHDCAFDQFEIVYQFQNMGTHQRVNLKLVTYAGEIVPSIKSFFANADWMEREQNEMFNLTFGNKLAPLLIPKGQTNFPLLEKSVLKEWPLEPEAETPVLPFNPNKSEAPYPEESYVWKNYDLLSPMTRGNFEWQLCYDPVKVVDSKLNVGFHFEGLEKLFESKDMLQLLMLTDKINFSSAPTYSILWAKTLEEIYQIEIPERAAALRIVLLEMARLCDHLTVLSHLCQSAKKDEFKLYLNAREKVYELFEKFCGHRRGLGIASIGGLKEDLPPGWIVEYQTTAEILNKTLRVIHRSLISDNRFRGLLEGESMNSQDILKWGVGGPAMRAAGLNFDLRKSEPIYFYPDIDFDIPVGIHGTSYDRFLIRHEEMVQSLRIITQVIDNLPLGEVLSQDYRGTYPELISKFQSLPKNENWHYSALESPGGEAGFLVKFGKTLSPERIKLKTPGFALAQAMPVFVKGIREEQVPLSLLSLGLSRWEMDR